MCIFEFYPNHLIHFQYVRYFNLIGALYIDQNWEEIWEDVHLSDGLSPITPIAIFTLVVGLLLWLIIIQMTYCNQRKAINC